MAAQVMWANPMLTIPELAKMAKKDEGWIRQKLRLSENPIPHYKVGSRMLILWSDYVTWFTTLYAPGSELYGKSTGKKHH